jgi:hypothetical protein
MGVGVCNCYSWATSHLPCVVYELCATVRCVYAIGKHNEFNYSSAYPSVDLVRSVSEDNMVNGLQVDMVSGSRLVVSGTLDELLDELTPATRSQENE